MRRAWEIFPGKFTCLSWISVFIPSLCAAQILILFPAVAGMTDMELSARNENIPDKAKKYQG